MSYGLNIKTSSDDIIIDGDYRSIRPFQTGSHGSTSFGEVSISHRKEPRTPWVFVHPHSTWVGHKESAAGFDESILNVSDGDGFNYSIASPSAPDGDFMHDESWGVRVFDSQGDVGFDSRERGLILVRDVLTVNPQNLSLFETHERSHARVQNPYYLISPLQGLFIAWSGQTDIAHYLRPFFRAKSETSIEFEWKEIKIVPMNQDVDGRPSQWIIVVAELAQS